MLTRIRYRNDFRSLVRCLSDKKDDGKVPENQEKSGQDDKTKSQNPTDKIQELLKSMMAEPKISDAEYRQKFATAPEIPKKPKEEEEDIISIKMEKIEEKITKAAGDVAQAIGGDVKKTEAELLSRVLGKINQTSTTLSDLLVGMKVDRTKETEDGKPVETRGQHVKRLVQKSTATQNTRFAQRKASQGDVRAQRDRPRKPLTVTSVNLFGGNPLGIFQPSQPNYGTELQVWEKLKDRELALATAQPPANYFEKMILWTEQGKVWKFPIDNEQGLEEEKKVHFSEHIFIDSYLEGWCPKKGPIRHFMELVCVGLSKNAFYTAQEKKDHIMWYREYFESKKDLLTDVGAWNLNPGKNVESP